MIIRQRGKPSPLLGASGPGGFVAIVAHRKTAALLLPRQAAFHLLSCDASDSRADARLAATRSRCFNYRASYPRIDGGRSPLVRLFYTNTTLTTGAERLSSKGLLLRLNYGRFCPALRGDSRRGGSLPLPPLTVLLTLTASVFGCFVGSDGFGNRNFLASRD